MRLETDSIVITDSAVSDNGLDPQCAAADFQEILTSGITAAQNGDRVRARRLLFQASGIDPRCEDIWIWLASISEYPEELLIFLGNALEINPENQRALEWQASTRSLLAKTFVQRAVAAHEEGSMDRAQQCIQQALVFDENCALAWLWKASFAKDENEKIGFLERVLEIDPKNADARTALDAILTERSHSAFHEVKSAAAAGRRKKALDLVNEFLQSEPNIADAWILRSHLSLGLGEKIESLERALEINPENTTARSAYDFLTATVNSCSEQTDRPEADTAPHENQSSAVSSVDNQEERAIEIAEVPTDLVEMPLSSVFEAPESPVDEVAQALDDSPNAVEVAPQPTDETVAFESAVEETFQFDDSLIEAHSESFENTFLETFDVDSSLAENYDLPEYSQEGDAQVLSLEELQPLELTQPVSEFEPAPEYSGVSNTNTFEFAGATAPDEPLEFEPQPEREHVVLRSKTAVINCPYCDGPNKAQAFSCGTCNSTISLSDIESLLNNSLVDREIVQKAVTQMEAEWNLRDFSETELVQLGIGYFNLGEFEAGFRYIQEASRLDPNNVILAGQLNTIAIRLDEIRRQNEVHDAMPKGKTILIVDDSATVRKLIASKLEKSGHQVVCAEDGVEALERLDEGLPDLVLLDIAMPRMDGYEVCKQIRNNPAAKDLPVVMISGKDGFFDKVRGKMAGSTGYVTKPFGPETLMKALETYLLPEHQEQIAD